MGKTGTVTIACWLLTATTVGADTTVVAERLLHRPADIRTCRNLVASTLIKLGALPEQIRREVDTGDQYRVKIVSSEANLVFVCDSAALEILRTTPGEVPIAGR